MTLEPSLELSLLGPGNISHSHHWDCQDKIHIKHFYFIIGQYFISTTLTPTPINTTIIIIIVTTSSSHLLT